MDQWINKHHPTLLSECLVGGKGSKEKIIGWMNQRSRKTGLPCLLISGQCGTGKSTLVEMIGKQPNVVMSRNYASDERTSEKMTKMLNDLIFRPVFKVVPKEEYKIFVIDEADSSTDGPLLTWVANNAETYGNECSFIVIVNDPNSKPVRNFTTKMTDRSKSSSPKLLHIKLDPFTDSVIIGVLQSILEKEQKRDMDATMLMEIVEGANGDLRKAINELQWWCLAQDKMKTFQSTPITITSSQNTASPDGFDKVMEAYDAEKDIPGFTKLMSTQNIFTFMQQARTLMYAADKEDRVRLAFALGEYDKFLMPLMMGTNALQMVSNENIENSVYAPPQKKQGRFGLSGKPSKSEVKRKELGDIKFCLDLCDSFCHYDIISSNIHQNHGENWEMEEYGLAAGFARPLLLLSLGKKPTSTWQPPILMPTKHHYATNIQPKESEVDNNWRIEMEHSIPKTSWCLDFKPMLRIMYASSLSTIYEGKDSEMRLKQMEIFVRETKTTPERFSSLEDLKLGLDGAISMSSRAIRKAFNNIMASYKQEHRSAKKVDVNPSMDEVASLDDKPKGSRTKAKPKQTTSAVRSRVTKVKQCLLDDDDVPKPEPVAISSSSTTLKPRARLTKKSITSPIAKSPDPIAKSPDPIAKSPDPIANRTDEDPAKEIVLNETEVNPPPLMAVTPKQPSRFSTKRSAPIPSAPEPSQKKRKLESLTRGQCKISSYFGKAIEKTEPKSDGSDKASISGPKKKTSLKNLLSAFDDLEGKVVHRQ